MKTSILKGEIDIRLQIDTYVDLNFANQLRPHLKEYIKDCKKRKKFYGAYAVNPTDYIARCVAAMFIIESWSQNRGVDDYKVQYSLEGVEDDFHGYSFRIKKFRNTEYGYTHEEWPKQIINGKAYTQYYSKHCLIRMIQRFTNNATHCYHSYSCYPFTITVPIFTKDRRYRKMIAYRQGEANSKHCQIALFPYTLEEDRVVYITTLINGFSQTPDETDYKLPDNLFYNPDYQNHLIPFDKAEKLLDSI